MQKAPPLIYLLRASADPDPYEAALEAAGFRCRSIPVLDFELVNEETLREVLAQPGRYAGLVLTSPRAVEALAETLPWLPNQTAEWMVKEAFAVGPRTSEALRGLGFCPQGEEAGSAEALAGMIERRAEAFAAPLLFLCGDRRRDVLPERLRAAGIAFEERVVYRARPREAPDLPGSEPPDWIVFFSPSGVEAMQWTSEVGGRPAKVAAIGPTTAEALRQAGWAVAAVAKAPSPEALAEALAAREPRSREGV